MLIKAAMWVHGTAVAVEFPEKLVSNGIVRAGDGAHFYGHSGSVNWFHAAIPSPVILDGVRPALSQVCVLYRLGPGASGVLTKLHLYDGPYLVWQHDCKWTGDHRETLDTQNTLPLLTNRPVIKYGLNVAMQVKYADLFDEDDSPTKRTFDFYVAAVGADFVV